jgi:integrase
MEHQQRNSSLEPHLELWHRLRDDYEPLSARVSDIGRVVSREELQNLAKVAQEHEMWEAIFYGFVLAVNTGLRGGEIKKLRIGAIDIQRRCLVVRRNSSKTDAGARHVELNDDATEAVLRLLSRACSLGSQRSEHFLLPKHLSRIKYGPDVGKRAYDPTQHQNCWRKAWASLTEKANLKSLRFHDLRHTFITHMIERGAPVALIQSLVGHVNARIASLHPHYDWSGTQRCRVARC